MNPPPTPSEWALREAYSLLPNSYVRGERVSRVSKIALALDRAEALGLERAAVWLEEAGYVIRASRLRAEISKGQK